MQLVPAYDAQSDQELSALNTQLTTFVTTMASEARTPQGNYDHNKDFYIAAQARLATLRLRAETFRTLGVCPTNEVVRAAVQRLVPETPPLGASPSILTSASVLARLPHDDCGVGLLVLASDALGDLQRFHQAQGPLGIPPSARDPILVGGVGSLLRSAIAVEISKRNQRS